MYDLFVWSVLHYNIYNSAYFHGARLLVFCNRVHGGSSKRLQPKLLVPLMLILFFFRERIVEFVHVPSDAARQIA